MSRTYFFLPCAVAVDDLTQGQREKLIARYKALGADFFKGWTDAFNETLQDALDVVQRRSSYTEKNVYLTVSERKDGYVIHAKTNVDFAGNGGAVYDYRTFMDMTADKNSFKELLATQTKN